MELSVEIIDAWRRGDKKAYELIVRQYGGGVLGYLVKMCRNKEMAEDCFQQTFLKVYEKSHTFKGQGGCFKSWLYRIATNAAFDGLRKEKTRAVFSLNQDNYNDCEAATIDIIDNSNNPSSHADRKELAELVRGLISKLTEKQRTILILAYYQKLSYAEIAEVMNCSKGTVKTQMFRALKSLADKLPEGAKF